MDVKYFGSITDAMVALSAAKDRVKEARAEYLDLQSKVDAAALDLGKAVSQVRVLNDYLKNLGIADALIAGEKP